MIRLLSFLAVICFIQISYSQQDGNELYEHDLNEEKWENIRDGIRYEGRDGAGRQWTYEDDQSYRDAVRRNGSGGSGSGGGSGDGNGGTGGHGSGGDGSGATDAPEDYNSSPPPPRRRSSSSGSSGLGGLGALGYILLGVFLVGLIFLIYYLFVNAPKDGKKVGTPIHLDEINPTEIPLTELERLLQEALAKGDFRGAVRIYFIFIIRDLAEKRWIQWEKEKTNFHYLREMAGKNEYDDFNRSVSYFEIIWYGKRELDSEKFDQIKHNFTHFLDKLGVR